MSPAEFIDNPDWAKFIPEAVAPARARNLPAHEDCSRLDPEAVAAHLRRGGVLGRMPGYEERPGQLDMAAAIARAFNNREHLMIEAGTGVGKSLAYLLPSILWAWTNDTAVVISTETRNLQSQLLDSDIPRALAVLGEEARDFKVALLKGRTNYLCLKAVGEFFAAGYWTMSAEDQALMPGFIDFLKTTRDGDLDRYDGLNRSLISCPGEECAGRRCPFRSRCFVHKARLAAADAHLVVVNHALALADASAPGSGLLPVHGRLVFDEAHDLESIATEFLQHEFSLPELNRILNRLLRRGHGRRGGTGGVLAALERQLNQGTLCGSPAALEIGRKQAEIPALVVRAVNETEDFLALAAKLLRPAGKREVCRYRFDRVRMYSLNGLFEPYDPEFWDEAAFKRAQTDFEAALAQLVNQLHALRDLLEDVARESERGGLGELAVQFALIADSLVNFANEANFTIQGDKPTHAYWIERVRSPKRPAFVRMVAAPLSVAADLKEMFFKNKDSVILSSATLRVGNSFRYMARRLGCEEIGVGEGRFEFLHAQSPFDYFRQSLVLAPDYLPEPGADPQGYARELAAMMKELFAVTGGRSLVLFTSYEMMNAVAEVARAELTAADIRLVVQGEGMTREAMTELLRRGEERVVLFGAQSFWQGVDVAGEALSCVVLARLPFLQMRDPVYEARCELIDREGGKSFPDYSVPEAVIRFRQGFGRLIRSRRDRGVVVVTDPRLVTKNYGPVFRRSIPATVHTVTGHDELLARVGEFFNS